jgi:hypothetical protein
MMAEPQTKTFRRPPVSHLHPRLPEGVDAEDRDGGLFQALVSFEGE